MPSIAIYTVLIGNRDAVRQPKVVDSRVDYVLFTDNLHRSDWGIWQPRLLEGSFADASMASRYPKILAHRALPEYKASLYMDANIAIESAEVYERVRTLAQQGVDWAGMAHTYHDCLYAELQQVVELGLEQPEVAAAWRQQLLSEGFPAHAGMYENGIIFRCHTARTAAIEQRWWELYSRLSRRDQLSLRYVLWQMGVGMSYLFSPPESPRRSPHFSILPHLSSCSQLLTSFAERK